MRTVQWSKLSQEDYKEMLDEIVKNCKGKLGLDEKTANRWAKETIKIIREQEESL